MTSEQSIEIALVRLEGKLDNLTGLMNEKLARLEGEMQHGDKQSSQAIELLTSTSTRLEKNQADQGKRLRALEDSVLRAKTIAAVFTFLGGGSGAGLVLFIQQVLAK